MEISRIDVEKCIAKVLKDAQLTKQSPVFKEEWDFHSKLAICLKEHFGTEAHIVVEYAEVNFDLDESYSGEKTNLTTNWIDIVIETENKFYPIEIKYSEYCGKNNIAGSQLPGAIRSFLNNIDDIKSYKKYKLTETGYGIFVTNDIEYMNSGYGKDILRSNAGENYIDLELKPVNDFGYLIFEIPLKDKS